MTFWDAGLFIALLSAATGIIFALLKMLWASRKEGVNKDLANLKEYTKVEIGRIEDIVMDLRSEVMRVRDERHKNTESIAENEGRTVILSDDMARIQAKIFAITQRLDYMKGSNRD